MLLLSGQSTEKHTLKCLVWTQISEVIITSLSLSQRVSIRLSISITVSNHVSKYNKRVWLKVQGQWFHKLFFI